MTDPMAEPPAAAATHGDCVFDVTAGGFSGGCAGMFLASLATVDGAVGLV